MDTITIDGLDEHVFRRAIEDMLRQGQADLAATKLRTLLEPYAGEARILPPRFLTVSAGEVAVAGWDQLEERIGSYDRPEHPISALCIAVAEPEEPVVAADTAGPHGPHVETSYFSDDAYPFSEAARSDLLDGYSTYGCQWDGECERTDTALSVKGLDDLYGAVSALEARLLQSDNPDAEEIRAGSLGACYLSVLMHQAVRDAIRENGLPRPLCVMAGNNGTYPFFDAPVISSEESLEDGLVKNLPASMVPASTVADEPETVALPDSEVDYERLFGLGSRKGKKKPVIVLDAADAASAAEYYDMAGARHMAGDHPMEEGGAPADREVLATHHPHGEDGVEPAVAAFEDGHPGFVPEEFSPAEAVDSLAPDEPQGDGAGHQPNEPDITPVNPEDGFPGTVEAEPVMPEFAALATSLPEPSVFESVAAGPVDANAAPDAVEFAPDVVEPEPATFAPEPHSFEVEQAGGPVAAIEPEAREEAVSEVLLNPSGHSLRARFAQAPEPQASATWADRIAALLRWLTGWLKS